MRMLNHSLEDLTQISKILNKGIILGKTGSVTFLFECLLLDSKDLCSFIFFKDDDTPLFRWIKADLNQLM
jgi:hypothetical protein